MSGLGLLSGLSIGTLSPGRSALTIFATCAALFANCGGVLAETPQFNGQYVYARLAPCPTSASTTCRRRPNGRSSAAIERPPNSASSVEFGWEFGPGSVRLQGNAEALRLEVHDSTIATVLAAIGRAFGVQYRSSTPIDDAVSGTYTGSLTRVIANVLDGYNYAIKHEGSVLDVSIFGRSPGQGTPAASSPAIAPVRHGRCGRSAGHQAACRPI